jgi:protein-disulfide isomerase
MRTATIVAFLLGAGIALTGSWYFRPAAPAVSTEQIEGVVARYLDNNPEAVVDAIRAFQAKEEKQAREDERQLVRANADEIFRQPGDPVLGNPQGDITLVEFFDYRCGYCKRALDSVLALAAQDGNVRIVLKEFPILGQGSVLAARASLAALKQDRYAAFHELMMRHNGDIDAQAIESVAVEAGLDAERLRTDMNDAQIITTLKRNYELAETLGIKGTPAFLVGDQLIPGAVSIDKLKQAVATARKGTT